MYRLSQPDRRPHRHSPRRAARRRLAGAAALALGLLPLAACGSGGGPESGEGDPDPDAYAVVAGPDDGEVALAKGERLLLRLDVHPSVGYEWEVTDPAAVLAAEYDWTVTEGDPEQAGNRATRYLVYEAEVSGDAEIGLRHTFRGDTERTTSLRVTVG